jgi:hypothetical protein
MFAEVGVGEVGAGCRVEAEDDLGDDVAVAFDGVEDAGAIREAACLVGKFREAEGLEVECAHPCDGLRDLLAVGADVLNGRRAGQPGDAGEAFHAGDSLLAEVQDQSIPVGAGGDFRFDGGFIAGEFDRFRELDLQDQAGVALVRNDKVGAAAEREDGKILLAGEADGFEQIGFGGDAGEVAGRASDAEGGERGEGDVLFEMHRVQE